MPGIAIGNCIPFRSGGESWSSYWATLISATVENAAPTHVVLTFPSAQTSLGATDFTIAGFTVSSASWTGAVLTLVLSEAVLVFDGDLIITFVTTSETATVTNNVADDTNTVYLLDEKRLDTFTRDESGVVSVISDALGESVELSQASEASRGILGSDGLFLDGINDFYKSGAFTLNQPTTIYIVCKIRTWAAGNTIIDGNTIYKGTVRCKMSPPQIAIWAGADLQYNHEYPVGYKAVITAAFNGANSRLRVNLGSVLTGNAGANNMGGITLGAIGDGSTGFSQSNVYGLVFRKVADNIETEEKTIKSLMRRHDVSHYLFDNGKVILTFDDGRDTTYSQLLSILQTQGISATIFLIGNKVDTLGYVTWDNVAEMALAGVDFQCHTFNHTNLTTISKSEIMAETVNNDAIFTANSLPIPVAHAYPWGAYDEDVINAITPYRSLARKVTTYDGSYYIRKYSPKYELPSLQIDGIDAAGIASLKTHLDKVALQKTAIILYAHDVEAGAYGTPVSAAALNEIIDYIQSKDLDIITMSELSELMDI